MPRSEIWAEISNLSYLRVVEIFFENKFLRIYSFLFGLGFAMQLERANRQLSPFLNIYIKRVLSLLIIGLIHSAFWEGDILKTYAPLAFFLLPFRTVKLRTILIWAAIFLIVPSIILTSNEIISPSKQQYTQERELIQKQLYSDYTKAFQQGSFLDVMKINLVILVNDRKSVDYFTWCLEVCFLCFFLDYIPVGRNCFTI